MDLTTGFPRSPYNRLHNIVLLPRTIDKIRADLDGKLGEYVWRTGFSADLLELLELDQDATGEAVANGAHDAAVWDWMRIHMRPPTPIDIAVFNRYIIERRPLPARAEDHRQFFDSIGMAGVGDIATYCERQDADESRESPHETEARNLTMQPPRSPYEKFLGLVNLPRLLDKARADLADKLGAYHWRVGQSLVLLEFLDIGPDDLFEAAHRDSSDDALCEWIVENMAERSSVDTAMFNRAAIQSYPATSERMEHHRSYLESFGRGDIASITSAFERLSWEEDSR